MQEIKNLEQELETVQLDSSPLTAVRNHIYLTADIEAPIAKALINALIEEALSIAEASLETGLLPCPIELHINSYGGDAYSGFQIAQTILNIQNGSLVKVGNINIPIEVNTHIEGIAASAASIIACVGNYRTMSKYALALMLEPWTPSSAGGKAKDIEIASDNLKICKEIGNDIYLSHSKLTLEELSEILKDEKLSKPEQLLKWGLIDEII